MGSNLNSLEFREQRKLIFEDSLVILDIGRRDTMNAVISELQVDELTLKNTEKVVQKMSFTLEHNDEEFELIVHKDYTEFYKTGF